MRKAISIIILVAFISTSVKSPAYAQNFHLPAPGVMVHLSSPLEPPVLKGINVHTDNPFRFDFILDRGSGQLDNGQLKEESTKLIKYFLTSLTIPEKDLWVNLSPYEKDRIIPQSFGLTEMGRDLLAEDYMLKQITASLIYPEGEVGKRFWKRVYEIAAQKFGTTNIPVNTFNKVWIVPYKAVVYENAKAITAYVMESRLKVMLEQDYLSLEKHLGIQAKVSQGKNTNQLASQVVREIVIPELTKEVNEDKNFATLRQVYNSLILATWYKKKIKDSILEQVYSDKNKIAGVNIDDPQEKEKIYQRYLQAFKKGVYNYIKEERDPLTQDLVPRKYFSGGVPLFKTADILKEVTDISDSAMLDNDKNVELNVKMDMAETVESARPKETDSAMINRKKRINTIVSKIEGAVKALNALGWKEESLRRKGPKLPLQAVEIPALPQRSSSSVELDLPVLYRGSNSKSNFDYRELANKVIDIMMSKIDRVFCFLQLDETGRKPSLEEVLSNKNLLKRYHEMMRDKTREGGRNLLKHRDDLPKELVTAEDFQTFYNWVKSTLDKMGYPIDKGTKVTLNPKALEEAIGIAKTKFPDGYGEVELFIKMVQLGSLEQAIKKFGVRKFLAILQAGRVKWVSHVMDIARDLTATKLDVYPIVQSSHEVILVDLNLREKIFAHLYNFQLVGFGGGDIWSRYDPRIDVSVIAPEYYEEGQDKDGSPTPHVNNPLDFIRNVIHESRHRQLAVEAGTAYLSAYGVDDKILNLEEGRVNLETQMILEKFGDYVGSSKQSDIDNIHLLASSMTTPLDYRKPPGQHFVISDTEMFMGGLLAELVEYSIKGRTGILSANGEQLMALVFEEMDKELRHPGSSIVRDDVLIQGARRYEQTREVTEIPEAFHQFMRTGQTERTKLLTGSGAIVSAKEQTTSTVAGFNIDANKEILQAQLETLEPYRFDLPYILSEGEMTRVADILVNAYEITHWGKVLKILAGVPGENVRTFLENAVGEQDEWANSAAIEALAYHGNTHSVQVLRERFDTITYSGDAVKILHSLANIDLDGNLGFMAEVLNGNISPANVRRDDEVRATAAALIGKASDSDRAKEILTEARSKIRNPIILEEIGIALNEIEQRIQGIATRTNTELQLSFRKPRNGAEIDILQEILSRNHQYMSDISLIRVRNVVGGFDEKYPQESYIMVDDKTNRILGGMVYYVDGEQVYLVRVAVHPDFQKDKAYEDELFEQFVGYLQARGIKRIVKAMREDDARSLSKVFDKRHGFQKYGYEVARNISQDTQVQAWKPKKKFGLNVYRLEKGAKKKWRDLEHAINELILSKPNYFYKEHTDVLVRDLDSLFHEYLKAGQTVVQLLPEEWGAILSMDIMRRIGGQGNLHVFDLGYEAQRNYKRHVELDKPNFHFNAEWSVAKEKTLSPESTDVVFLGALTRPNSLKYHEEIMEQMLREADSILRPGGYLIVHGNGLTQIAVGYYGEDILKAKYEPQTIATMANPHEWLILHKKGNVLATTTKALPSKSGRQPKQVVSASNETDNVMTTWQDFVVGGIKENPTWENNPVYQRFRDYGLGDSNTDPIGMVTQARRAMDDFDIKVKPGGVGLVLGFGRKGIGEVELTKVYDEFSLNQVHGVDWVNYRVKEVAEALQAQGHSPKKIILHHANMQDMKAEIKDRSIDLIYGFGLEVIGLLDIDQNFAKELVRVLTPEGVVYLLAKPNSEALAIFNQHGQIFKYSEKNSIFVFKKNADKGGIDLTSANMNLQTQNQGGKVKFHLDPAMLQRLQNAPGFVPVIINIQPMRSLRLFLGLSQNNPSTIS